MPKISSRGTAAYKSPIRKLSTYADQAKKEGKKVYHLNIGQPDIKTPKAALTALQHTEIDVLAYSPSQGYESLRKKLLQYYQKFDIQLSPSDFIVTNGASEGIFFSLLACLDEGEEVIIPEPFYANYLGFAQIVNAKVIPITSSIENGFALPTLSAFEEKITPRTRAILLCNPSNPTGAMYDEPTLRALATLVKKHDLYLIVDEVYREFCYGETPFFSALNLEGCEQNVIVLDSISKRYSACGARVGMIVTRNEALIKIITQYAEIRLSPPMFGQLLAEYLVDTPASYLDAVKAAYIERRNLLYQRLSQMEGVKTYLPEGAFYCFAQLPIDDADRFCQWLLEHFEYQNQTVMLAPGSGFYCSEGLGNQEVRIAYVLNIEDLNKAMDCLEAALKAYPHRI